MKQLCQMMIDQHTKRRQIKINRKKSVRLNKIDNQPYTKEFVNKERVVVNSYMSP